MMVPMFDRLKARPEWKFFGVLLKADRALAIAWWAALGLRGLLPALFAIAMGALVGAVQRGNPLGTPLIAVGAVFVLLQITPPFHHAVGANLGSRVAAWLYDQLTIACVTPPGMGHLEDPRLTTDLAMARDFDLGISGPPMSISMDFIASGLVEMVGGLLSAVVLAAYAWWAPILLAGAWLATHWLLRESGVWRDRNTDEVREAQRHADYAYRLAVDPPAAKELRLFGLAPWTIERFTSRRRQLFELRWQATRLREQPVLWSLLIVLSANLIVFWALAADAASWTHRGRSRRHLRQRGSQHEHDRVRRIVVGARWRRGAGRRCAATARGDASGWESCARESRGAEHAGAGNPISQRELRVSRNC